MYLTDRCKVLLVLFSLLAVSYDSFANTVLDARNRQSVFLQLTQMMENGEFGNSQLDNVLPMPNSQSSLKRIAPTPFIIGGSAVARNAFPEYTLLISTDGAGNITGLCGGTVIASNKVLTAAHCSQDSASSYFLIPGFYSFIDSLSPSDLITLDSVVDHPNYRVQDLDFDLAVMTLSISVSITPAKVVEGNSQLVGRVGTVIGTGLIATTPAPLAPDLLFGVDTPIVSNASCSETYLRFTGENPITENMLCAGFANSGQGACSGDSGGPLFVGEGDRRAISGVVSFGFETCEDQRASSVYARASAFYDFIKQQSPNTEFVNLSTSLVPIYSILLDD